MTLVIQAPSEYRPELEYVFRVVLSDRLGLDWVARFSPAAGGIRIYSTSGDAAVALPHGLFGMPPGEWLRPSSLPELPLATVSDFDDAVPVLYGPSGPDCPAITAEDATVHVNVDVFGGVFFLLTRYEEHIESPRDQHGRFPARSSTLASAGLDRTPLADRYVELLWSALSRAWPRLRRKPSLFRVFLTHDVDHPSSAGEPRRVQARLIAGDLLRRRDPALATARLAAWVFPGTRTHSIDPVNTFDFLATTSEKSGLRSAFFFMTDQDRRPRDHQYNVDDPSIIHLVRALGERGHEIGLHAGYHSVDDRTAVQRQLARLMTLAQEAGIRQTEWGGRAHYLRWRDSTTWRAWNEAGLSYDSTLAWPDRVGFRCGTSHPYRTFDLLHRTELTLMEVPLIAMDVALRSTGAGPQEATETLLSLASECQRFGGQFTLLWHNNSLAEAGQKLWYRELIEALASLR